MSHWLVAATSNQQGVSIIGFAAVDLPLLASDSSCVLGNKSGNKGEGDVDADRVDVGDDVEGEACGNNGTCGVARDV
jgi:hypothetical protein